MCHKDKNIFENSLNSELLFLQIYVNDDIYLIQIIPLINDIEVVYDFFKENNYFKNSDNIALKLEYIRQKYVGIKFCFLNEVKYSYEYLKNKSVPILNYENSRVKNVSNTKVQNLINLIELKIPYFSNYEKYNEDNKKLLNIENEISIIKKMPFKLL